VQDSEIEIDNVDFAAPPLGAAVTPGDWFWSDLSRRLDHLTTLVRVQAHARAVPALANFLMQGLVC
jgi:hypothetical protein